MVNSDELATIQERMKELDIHNQSAFLRKMAVYGYAVNIDITPAKELRFLQRRCVNNLAQIAKYAQANKPIKVKLWSFKKAMLSYGNSIQLSWNTLQDWLHFRTSGQVGSKLN
jgi:hypothetical protein